MKTIRKNYYGFCVIALTVQTLLQATCQVGSIAVDADGVCINTLKVDFISATDGIATGLIIETLSIGETIVINGSLEIPTFTTAGLIHNDALGNTTTSLVVNADIDSAAAIADSKLATISTAGKVANSATTATNANTASTIVSRDASGNFSVGTITGNLSGNATTATSATTATNFTGSLSGDVTGTQSATVASTVGGQTAANIAAATVLANAATSANTASTIVKRDASGNFSTNMVTLVGTTTNATDAATKAYVDSVVGGTSLNTPSTLVKRDSTGSFAAQVISMTDGVHSGNLVLSANPSTSTTGNIMKGSNRFVHNTGTSNTFVGENAGNFTTSGTGQNSALGGSALIANTTGNNNTACGYNALSVCTTGSSNIALGSGAGGTLTTGSNNIYIGTNAGTASESGMVRIGGASQTACFIPTIGTVTLSLSATAVLIDSSTGKLGILVSSEKFKDNIIDMDDISRGILSLRPVTFTYKDDQSKTQQFGLIAEEVDKVFPAIVLYDENGEPKSVQYHVLPVLLLNEMKKQQETINKQEDSITDLQMKVERITDAMNRLQMRLEGFVIRVIDGENRA